MNAKDALELVMNAGTPEERETYLSAAHAAIAENARQGARELPIRWAVAAELEDGSRNPIFEFVRQTLLNEGFSIERVNGIEYIRW